MFGTWGQNAVWVSYFMREREVDTERERERERFWMSLSSPANKTPPDNAESLVLFQQWQ